MYRRWLLALLTTGLCFSLSLAQQNAQDSADLPSALVPERQIAFLVDETSINVASADSVELIPVLYALGVYSFVVTNESSSKQVVELTRISDAMRPLEPITTDLLGTSSDPANTEEIVLEPGETVTIRFTASTDKVGTWALSSGEASQLFFVRRAA